MENINTLTDIVDSADSAVIPETAPEKKAVTDTPDNGEFDVIIIGAGPAGITAGVYLGRKLINTLIISPDLGGQVLWTSDVENYPGYNVISGWDLAEKMKAQLMNQPVNLRIGDSVSNLELKPNGGIVRTSSGGEYTFKSLIITPGKRSRPLNVPGEEKFVGRGVTYCATCDGPLYRGKTVAVIGGGNSALSSSNELLDQGCEVFIINIVPGFQADTILIERAKSRDNITFYCGYQVVEILGENRVSGIRIRNNETKEITTLDVSGIFVEIGLIPNSSFAEGLIEMNGKKEILVDCRCRTSAKGVFAAGDVTNVPNKQIVIAAGEGAKSALTASAYLMGQ
ncbi:NAD(P)/FAD-dependent oxidoreductase [Candidatus Latescibacterota bacterium]